MVMRRAASSVDRAQFLPLQASIGPMFQVALDESPYERLPAASGELAGRLAIHSLRRHLIGRMQPSACADK